jgi:hypothetical protein
MFPNRTHLCSCRITLFRLLTDTNSLSLLNFSMRRMMAAPNACNSETRTDTTSDVTCSAIVNCNSVPDISLALIPPVVNEQQLWLRALRDRYSVYYIREICQQNFYPLFEFNFNLDVTASSRFHASGLFSFGVMWKTPSWMNSSDCRYYKGHIAARLAIRGTVGRTYGYTWPSMWIASSWLFHLCVNETKPVSIYE